MRRWLWALSLVPCALSLAVPAHAQTAQPVVAVAIEQEGQPVTERLITDLVETRVGEPLSMAAVRETIGHFMSLNRFDDVQAYSENVAGGVRVRYVLYPSHNVDRFEFRGTTGLSEGELRRAITERFTAAPPASRADEVAAALRQMYRDRGFPGATVTPRVEESHNPDRATLIFDIAAGARAAIERVEFQQLDVNEGNVYLAQPQVRAGQPYDAEAIDRELQRYEDNLRSRGYLEARASHTVEFNAAGRAIVTITADRGPVVNVAFTGDPLPEAERERLVPVRAEGSADEDLLEDASRAIENYLYARGYRDASADYTRTEANGTLTITYNIVRGRRYLVSTVELDGNASLPETELLPLLHEIPGQPFVQATLDAGTASIRNLYRSRGFTKAEVQATVAALPPAANASPADDRRVEIRVRVTEGPRTLVGDVAFIGNTVMTSAQLRQFMTTTPGRVYSETEVVSDRDKIDLEYLNRGYESVVVTPRAVLAENDTRADVTFTITEGPQAIVDHVIITGNTRTSTETIERELLLKPGRPLGYSARLESQQRLAALGLFRRVRIEELPHGGESRRDVLVQVEEAPPTTVDYGGGIEGGTRLRTDANGLAEERFEIVPRGSFGIGRRNMWGKNRSVNLFTRVSLRARDQVVNSPVGEPQPTGENSYGFNEYRIVGTFREPRIAGTSGDLLLTGIIDQAVRSSFNFIRKQVRAEVGGRVSPRYSVSGYYSFEHTRLFDEQFTEADDPGLIDRLFPQVRLSKFSASILRDTRSDTTDPAGGGLFVATTDLAARAIGSQVGFVKTYLQAFRYKQLPAGRRVVLALGGRLGAAHGFPRVVEDETVQDLPASERFFAGGDTTVRGFSLDRLGTEETITATGFPTGGNGVIILNAELRAAVRGPFDAVTFVDAGNVFKNVSDLDITNLRPAVGFGIHYRSPVGPIRVELGFNVHPKELVPGRPEQRSVWNISLGRAF